MARQVVGRNHSGKIAKKHLTFGPKSCDPEEYLIAGMRRCGVSIYDFLGFTHRLPTVFPEIVTEIEWLFGDLRLF